RSSKNCSLPRDSPSGGARCRAAYSCLRRPTILSNADRSPTACVLHGLLDGGKAKVEAAQQLGVDGDDEGGGAHEDGPHLGRQGDAEGCEDPRSEGYGNEVVAGAP